MRSLRIALAFAAALAAAQRPEIRREIDLRVQMRDGVRLSTNVFRPGIGARVPAVLVRTPYGKDRDLTLYYRGFVDSGYAVVLQDVRGRYLSDGRFDPLRQESADSEDTLNWVARQPWSNHRVAMTGGSYLGIAQWKAALTGNRFLEAIFPAVAGCDDYFDRFYSTGGAMKLGQRLEWIAENLRTPGYRWPEFGWFVWQLPLRAADRRIIGRRLGFFQDALNHPAYDRFWHAVSTRERLERVVTPVFAVGGWYDNFVESDLEAFRIRRANGRVHRLIVGPWAHNMAYRFPGFDFGPEAKIPLRRYQLSWFDHFVKLGLPPSPEVTDPPLRIFIMGSNRWRDESEWPLARAHDTALYLAGGGRLVHHPHAAEPPEHFVYDPRKPAPTTGGAVCCNTKLMPPGPLDQRAVEQRPDVLVYSSQPLERDVEVTGTIRVVLHVATSAPDTDFTAKLVDVHPDGYARILTDGILRLRYRESLGRPVLAKLNEVYQITIDAGVTSNVFLRGHRIRLEVSSSNFPRFDRNPNTGRPIADEKELRRATQTVYHDHARPSFVLLPVVPDSAGLVGPAFQAAAGLRPGALRRRRRPVRVRPAHSAIMSS